MDLQQTLTNEILALKEDWHRKHNPKDETPLEELRASGKLIGDITLMRALGAVKGLSASTLQKISAGTYTGNFAKIREIFQRAAADLRRRHQLGTGGIIAGKMYDFPKWQALKKWIARAVENSRAGDSRKLIWVLDHPGFGKTTSLKRLAQEFPNAGAATALESWKKSYPAALDGIARGVGLTSKFKGSTDAEQRLFSTLNAERTGAGFNPKIIGLDEVEFCGERAVNFWKSLLNETPLVMVIFCQPAFFQHFQTLGGKHSAQLMQRNVAVLQPEAVSAKQAALFLVDFFPGLTGEDLDFLAQTLASHANGESCPLNAYQGGGYRLCRHVCTGMATHLNGKLPTHEDLLTEIGIYRASQGLNIPLN